MANNEQIGIVSYGEYNCLNGASVFIDVTNRDIRDFIKENLKNY